MIQILRTRRVYIIVVALLVLVSAIPFTYRTLARAVPPLFQESQAEFFAEMTKAIEATKNQKYDEAVQHYIRAKKLDPTSINARLDLAMTYQLQYVPGATGEKNAEFARNAIEEYKGVLAIDSNYLDAIDGLGVIIFNVAGVPFDSVKMEDSKSYWNRHIRLRPNDPEPYYWIGLIDWTIAFNVNKDIRAHQPYSRRRVHDDEAMPEPMRAMFATKCGRVIDEGIDALNRALKLRPDYDDAMAYLSLLYRQKADTAETIGERNAMIKRADALMDQVKKIKQRDRNRD
jgi:tetratricopeptide (TPR) repeat protein